MRAASELFCEHGTAMDVHCCNCHAGFLFDVATCVCTFENVELVNRSARQRLSMAPDDPVTASVSFTEEEVTALLLEFDHIYVRRAALRTAIHKLTALYPYLCEFCHTTLVTGSHGMKQCTDPVGVRIKRENSE